MIKIARALITNLRDLYRLKIREKQVLYIVNHNFFVKTMIKLEFIYDY